jgi:hypothetical protein
LINPANEQLRGVSAFSYFPRGGPVPRIISAGLSNSWGGMEAGHSMLYSSQTVDGTVHAECGEELLSALIGLSSLAPNGFRCPTGQALRTPSFGALGHRYSHIIHTIPPFYSSPTTSPKLLAKSYASAFKLAWQGELGVSNTGPLRAVCPVLGAGCRGFPVPLAVATAARSSALWCGRYEQENSNPEVMHQKGQETQLVLCFAVTDTEVATQLERCLNEEFGR